MQGIMNWKMEKFYSERNVKKYENNKNKNKIGRKTLFYLFFSSTTFTYKLKKIEILLQHSLNCIL
jgi:hypothetical protein